MAPLSVKIGPAHGYDRNGNWFDTVKRVNVTVG
jgi:hypothetical protein